MLKFRFVSDFLKNSREKNLQERNILCQEDLKVNKKNILILNFPLSSLFSNVILKEKLDFFISDFFFFLSALLLLIII